MDFITALFSEVDQPLGAIPTQPAAHLWPSEVGTLGLLQALKGVGTPLLSRVDARLSVVVSPSPRAHPLLSLLQDASGLDIGLHGYPHSARGN